MFFLPQPSREYDPQTEMSGPAPKASPTDFSRRHPDISLFLLGFLWTILIMPMDPHKMVSDSHRRFKSATWIWSGTNPGGRLPGVEGVGHYWDGVGQSLLFVPFDFILSALGIADVETRFNIVSRALFPAVNGLVLLLSWHALRELGFKPRTCSLGTLVTLGCTTLTFHFQNNQENPLMLAYALVAVIGILKWNKSGSLLWLNLTCAAQAASISIRVTNLAYVLPIFGLPMLSRFFDESRPWDWRQEVRQAVRMAWVAVPWLLAAFAIDRWWQWVRFGTLQGTYFSIFQKWAVANFDQLPPGFPFSVPFTEGFAGQLISPAKGVVFYEPLVIAALAFWLLKKTESTPKTKALVLVGCIATLGTAAGLARFYYWDSEPNWGPRYLATPAHLLELALAGWIVSNLNSRTWIQKLLGLWAICLMATQISGIWWPAYHESIEGDIRRGPEYVKTSSDLWSRGLPTVNSETHKDWVVVNRPVGVAKDIARQIALPKEEWLASKPPMRMIWITGTLNSLSHSTRWAVRLAWLTGLGLALWLARQAVVGTETPRNRT
ncbi:MAG: hypothetical protein RLZ45_1382 [Verrucomicrobiota bacterium]